MPRLCGQTLGLIGFGNIARTLVPKARGFGLQILTYTPRLSSAAVPDYVEVAGDLSELLARSDYVSIHAPTTPETSGLIGERELRLMKATAYLINTSRGALVDEDALARAVSEGWIAGAALDVLRQEPPPIDHPLRGIEGIILTPHASFYSETAIAELETKATRNVVDVLSGRIPETTVNPDVLVKPNLRLSSAHET
jgi:D-3-phosphoglycerate dehydrogenase